MKKIRLKTRSRSRRRQLSIRKIHDIPLNIVPDGPFFFTLYRKDGTTRGLYNFPAIFAQPKDFITELLKRGRKWKQNGN